MHTLTNNLSFIDAYINQGGNTINKNTISPYIRRAALSELPPGHSIARRIIFDYELIYVTGGKVRMIIGDKSYVCKKNNVILLRPGVPHEFHCFDDCNLLQPHIHFDLVYTKNSESTPISFKDRQNMTADELLLISEDTLDPSIPCVFSPYNQDRFANLFFGVIYAFRNREPNFELTAKIHFLELLSLIFTQFDMGHQSKHLSLSPAETVKSYIDSNYRQPVTLDSLQTQFFCNKYTLIRSFNKLYGKSPIAYYRERRLDFAKNILTNTNRTVASISKELSFPDIYSFSRFFKGLTGVSPTQYRSLIRRKI